MADTGTLFPLSADRDSRDVLAALIGISNIPEHLLEPCDSDDSHISDSPPAPAIHCRVAINPETEERSTVWISRSHDRQSQNITIFDGWRICVQVPVADWVDHTYTAEDVRRAALLCMGRQYLKDGNDGIGGVTVSIKEGAEVDTMDPEAMTRPTLIIPPFEASSRPTSSLLRPGAPEPLTPAGTAENGHEPLESSDEEPSVSPPDPTRFLVLSRSDTDGFRQIDVVPPRIAWWRRVRVPRFLGMRRLAALLLGGCSERAVAP